jgi:ketosteroid isomerase-like protein
MQTNNETSRVVRQFITAFQERDPLLIPDLVGEGCVMEGMQPAPNGARVVGYRENVAVWQAMIADTSGQFENEDLAVAGDRAIQRWRYHFADGTSLRGVTLFRVEGGRIVEALAYGKTTPVLPDAATADVIRRFNDVFQHHDPSALRDLVAADCVLENTTPAPNGARYVGRDECVALWTRIATSPGMRFETEAVFVAGDRATIRWRLIWGASEQDSVRGVNLMRVKDGQIVEALGYVKGGQ